VYQGTSGVHAELAVAVTVGSVVPTGGESLPFVPWMSRQAEAPFTDQAAAQQQQ
jgi:hypothetical protein